MKDLQDSEGSGSDKDSDKSSEEEEEEEEEEDGGSSGKVVELDLKASYNAFANSYDKKTKLYSATTSGWYSGIGKKVADKFAVEFGNNCSPVMVGYISKDKYNQNAANYNSGFCYYVSSNYLYGSNMISGSSYSGASYNSGSVLGVEFFRKKGIIGYYSNGSYIKDAFNNIDKKAKLFPLFELCGSGCTFKFVKPKFKKIKK